jgi:hypothetical protein
MLTQLPTKIVFSLFLATGYHLAKALVVLRPQISLGLLLTAIE